MTHRPNLSLALVAALAVGTGALSACMAQPAGGGASSVGEKPRLRLALNFTPRAELSPYTDDAVSLARMGVIESLVTFDADGMPQPALAEKFEMTNASTATFTLRQGVTFHDGTALDAKAVADSLNHALTASPAPATVSGRSLTITAEGDRTVKVVSATPDPILVQRFGNPDMAILAAKAFAKDPNKPSVVDAATGPFELVSLTGSTAAKVDANAAYWGGAPQLSGLDVAFVSKGDSRVSGLRSGEYDVVQNVPIAQVANITDQVVDTHPIPRTTGLSLNTKSGPLTDVALRVAIAEAVDPKAIATSVFEGQGDPASGYFRGNTSWTADRPAPDFPAAKRPTGTTITIATYDDRPELPEAATLVAEQLRTAGFTVNGPVVKSYAVLEPELFAGKYDVVIGSRMYLSKATDPVSVLQSDFGCKGAYNLARYCDAAFDALLDRAAAITDVAARRKAAVQAEAKVLGAGVYVPLVHETVREGHVQGVTGLAADPLEWRIVTAQTALAR